MPIERLRSNLHIFLLVVVLSAPRPLLASSQLEPDNKDDGRDLCMSDVRSLAVCMLCYHRTNEKMLNCCRSMDSYNQCLDNISDLAKQSVYEDLLNQKSLSSADLSMQPYLGERQQVKRALEEIRPDLEPLLEDDDDIKGWEDYELDQLEELIKRRSPFLGKRRSPFLGKRRSPFLGKRRSPFLGKRRSPFLGKRRSPFLGKRDDGAADILDLSDINMENEKRGRSPFLG